MIFLRRGADDRELASRIVSLHDGDLEELCNELVTLPCARSHGSRAIWQLDQVQVYDGAASGKAGSNDATLFEDQGVFVP